MIPDTGQEALDRYRRYWTNRWSPYWT